MKALVSCAAAALALGSAHVANAQSFTGPFIGVQGGWEETNARNPNTAVGVTPLAQTSDTGTVGVFMGYDKEVQPRIVLGAQVEANFPISSTWGNGAASLSVKRSVDLSVRAGYLVTRKTLLYVRGGYSNELIGGAVLTPAGYISGSSDRDGWLLGGGVEHKLTPKISARLEYRYTDLSEGAGMLDRHQVMAGVAYRF